MSRSSKMCGWVAFIVLLFSVLLSAQLVAGMETAVEAAAAESHTGSSATDPGDFFFHLELVVSVCYCLQLLQCLWHLLVARLLRNVSVVGWHVHSRGPEADRVHLGS